MKALTRPRSASGTTEIAMASTLASWMEAKMLCTPNIMPISVTWASGRRTSSSDSDASTATSCVSTTHCLRCPITEYWYLSISGPQMNCTVQGRPTMAEKEATRSALSPCPMR